MAKRVEKTSTQKNNKLYNLVVADDVFGRRHSLSDINDIKTYDFFKRE